MESIIDDDWELTCDLDARRSFEASARDADSIRRVIAIAKDHGIEFKLILAPYFPEYARRLDSMPSWLEWLSEELDTTIADYSLAIEDHASFADPIHLNWHGAKQLAQRMVERGDL